MFSDLKAAGAVLVIAAGLASAAPAQSPEVLAAQRDAYDAVRAKTILELQPFRDTAVVALNDETPLSLVSVNPRINAWFVLQIGPEGGRQESYHLENPAPARRKITLEPAPAPALVIADETGTSRCTPWAEDGRDLAAARASDQPFAPLCDGKLYLRNKVTGARTSLEAAAEFLRENVAGGESIVRFVRQTFFKDSELASGPALEARGAGRLALGPGGAAMDAAVEDRPVIATLMDIGLDGAETARMTMGLWYPVSDLPGVFASAIQPRSIARSVLRGPGTANALDGIEGRADVYLVGFDLGRFDLGFALGTDHPGLGWSPRPPASVRPRGMPGPDGVKSAAPLVRLGMVNPALADRTVAVFTGGFKRQHGAFKWGDYITLNFGTHYGFVEQGTIFSKLQPHLATLYVLDDGTIGMKTWEEADNALLPRLRFARQNGVPLVAPDPETGESVPAPLVTRWGPGNWSGSAKAELRTLRAGACMKENEGRRYLIYAYFSTATPSAMARTFQAYGCDYAMLLDMNALEHTYLALYVARGGKLHVQHMVPGMALIDKKARDGTVIPRFLGYADNRDLFYLTLKEGVE
ncbi:hypothetical protein Ga0609869_000114 [Rhodovulum iodosum]|uniref:Uncharacterized protein n=1 Tax=Rhodovulum iodosum TaxID=68291 RepID=A0ABV3XN74_9RHOB|nr:hypothetical protein [Rhodovulum robiginosum]RSK35896.1 hypothetical protein EJA01_06000 [Rhodovulum robiginosum]